MTPDEACTYPIDLETHYGYIYCLTFPNGKRYVGQSKRPWRQRWKSHKSEKSFCPALKNALVKYGIEEVTWELMDYADTPETLTDREAYYIQTLVTLSPNGYNVTMPCNAYPYPEEKRNRIRLGLALHHLHKTNPEATVEDAKQYIIDQDYKATHKVKKGTPEWIEQCKRVAKKREADLRAQGFSRKRVTREHIRKGDWKIAKGTQVTVYETGDTFDSISAFCEKYKIPVPSATLCLQKKNKHVHNFHVYPTGISKEEFQAYMDFWASPAKQQTGKLTCVETGKVYSGAKEVAEEQGVIKSRVYNAARFPSRTINGFHFTYVQ